MSAFCDFLHAITPLPSETREAIDAVTLHRELVKNTSLLSNGDVCREFHFIAKGMARVYYYKDGKDITAWFATENGIVSAIDSLFTGNPSIYNIELLEDSEVYSIYYPKMELIFEQHSVTERLGRLLLQQNYLLLDERMKLFAFCTAEERYERLLQQLPDIFQRVKLGFIASYLGITQEHLSRIRAVFRKTGG